MMAIYFELFVIFDVRNKYGSILKQFYNHVRTLISWEQISWKKLKARIIVSILIIDLEGSSSYASVMKGFGLCFVDLCVFIRLLP